MEKEFVPYQESLELKKLGFEERCLGHFWENLFYFETTFTHPSTMPNSPESCLAPTFSQAFRWFREKYSDLDFGVSKIHNGTNNYHYHINLTWEFFEGTYEEAELACLRKLIEIVKDK